MKTTVLDLYRGRLSVWVEDELSREVLTLLWQDAQINVLVARGKAGVQALVGSRPPEFAERVFGIVDRDFDDDNHAMWDQPGCDVLRWPAHELENLLLDFEALSQISSRESPEQIEARAKARAEALRAWMACKSVLRELHNELGAEFPTDPRQDLPSLHAAEEHLSLARYWTQHTASFSRWNDPQTRRSALIAADTRLKDDLQSGAWCLTFSGKEIFRHLRSHVPGLDRTPKRPPQPTPADRELNVAKLLCERLRSTGRIPPPVTRLRDVLRRRAKL